MENITLVPASELASLERWAEATREMPVGSFLVVTQTDNLRLQHVGREVGHVLKRQGRSVQVVTI